MSVSINAKRGRSAETRALIQERALERGEERSGAVDRRVRDMMKTIEQEMAANEGIYPHNGGALSAAELARRADVHPTTFFTKKQVALGEDVKDWLKKTKESNIVGKGPVRRNLSDRLDDWKSLYEGLAQSHRDTELELQQIAAELKEAHGEIDRVRGENERLRALLAKSGQTKVVPLRKRKD